MDSHSFCEEEEENGFFDAREEMSLLSDSNSETSDSNSHFEYDIWVRAPGSVKERRSSFLRRMEIESCDQILVDDFRGNDDGGAVLRMPCFESEYYSSRSLMYCGSFNNCDSRERDSNEEDEEDEEERESEEYREKKSLGTESEGVSVSSPMKRVKTRWLNRLRSFTCIDTSSAMGPNGNVDTRLCSRAQRVKVKQCNKRYKELSALYTGQDIEAHKGSILTMKFSPDGHYLASAGEDLVVKIWRVSEDERSNELDVPELDPSCLYFTVNQSSEVKPLFLDKEKTGKPTSMRQTSESACVVFPPKVFRISEKPLHEFRGHVEEILDLSWSKNNCLLSSSEDKTVRLWQVGCDHCLKVFSHSNYVTCVQFNPVDENYFISGSIDGKVRIWGIHGCQVVDWTDVREIVTAVCYRPDGQGGIVGLITGSCRFYNISDNRLQLDAQISLNSKKKSLCKITGFQFSPQDSGIVIVTSADSQIRVLHGFNVIEKFRGVRNAGNQISACFTSDGKHILSTSEDSSVHLWNCNSDHKETTTTTTILSQSQSQPKNVSSCERFSGSNALVAVPWSGFQESGTNSMPFSSSLEYFSMNQEFFLESFPKASATWPEEKLPVVSGAKSNSAATMHKSELKFLKASCKNTRTGSHAWGLVIVTAGWDGRIRSFHNYGLPIHR